MSFDKMLYSREFWWTQWVSRNSVATVEVEPLSRSPQYQQWFPGSEVLSGRRCNGQRLSCPRS